jgi:hypothetical protein
MEGGSSSLFSASETDAMDYHTFLTFESLIYSRTRVDPWRLSIEVAKFTPLDSG